MSSSLKPARSPRNVSVQPSLWDRLKDDIPELEAELHYLTGKLLKELPSETFKACMEAPRSIDSHDWADDTKRNLHRVVHIRDALDQLQQKGIVVDDAKIRDAVRRDLEALFSTERMEAVFQMTDDEIARASRDRVDLSDYPNVRRSVINFGIPAYAGKTGRFDIPSLEKELRDILVVFEPRLKRDSIKVTVTTDPKIGFEVAIDAILILTPTPERLRFRTKIDLDLGFAKTHVETT